MKTIAIAAVTAGGKTTVVNALKERLPNAQSLHFDDYSFDGPVQDFARWVRQGANYHVWDLAPLKRDILAIRQRGDCDWLILDYPFAYCHKEIAPFIDCAIFIDTPLDIAMARRILRDMRTATGDEIRREMERYLSRSRIAYAQMHKDILPSSDHIVDGALELPDKIDAIMQIIHSL